MSDEPMDELAGSGIPQVGLARVGRCNDRPVRCERRFLHAYAERVLELAADAVDTHRAVGRSRDESSVDCGDRDDCARRVTTIDLTRPYIDGGVPPHYRGYDRGFQRWLALHKAQPDFVSDDDLDGIASAGELARAHDLIVLPGHEEYVTAHKYDLIQRYRDLGGNLAFLSANNFFYKVVKQGDQELARHER
jgi:hypothetical protein